MLPLWYCAGCLPSCFLLGCLLILTASLWATLDTGYAGFAGKEPERWRAWVAGIVEWWTWSSNKAESLLCALNTLEALRTYHKGWFSRGLGVWGKSLSQEMWSQFQCVGVVISDYTFHWKTESNESVECYGSVREGRDSANGAIFFFFVEQALFF